MMESQRNKRYGAVKEEGELTDDDEDDAGYKGYFVRSSWGSLDISGSRGIPRHSSVDRNKNYEDRFSSRRKDFRRRVEADCHRSSFRPTSEGGSRKHHREQQDSRQTLTFESYTPSKFWANRQFRASSVRPLSAVRYTKPSVVSKRVDSPQQHRHQEQNEENSIDGRDELERLQREQQRIREQLRSLEEEEEEERNDESSEKDSVLESLDARSETGEEIVAANNSSSPLNYILEAEKSDEEDIDIQKLRSLALATSERHIRLMANELQMLQPSVPNDDVVIIPDVELDMPEPEILTVEEEEDDVEAVKVDRILTETSNSAEPVAAIPPQKVPPTKKKKRKKKAATKGSSSVKKKMHVQDKEKGFLRSKVIQLNSKEGKAKKHKKEDTKQASQQAQQLKELMVLVMHNPKDALDKLLKYATERKGDEKPIVTGTIKDLKRQRQIPVLSDKAAVQSFSQKSANKRILPQEKSKEAKEHSRKSGLLQDNYDEVEMDIDSNAEDEEERPTLSGTYKDFNQPSVPVSSINVDCQSLHQSFHPKVPDSGTALAFPFQSAGNPVIPFSGMLHPALPSLPPPPLPPPPPPPPPPLHPPVFEQNLPWKDPPPFIGERIAEVNNSGRSEESLYSGYLGKSPDLGTMAVAPGQVKEIYDMTESIDQKSQQHSGEFPDDFIAKQLRLIRHSQDKNSTPGSPLDLKVKCLAKGQHSTMRFVFDDSDITTSRHVRSLMDYSTAEDMKASHQDGEYFPAMDTRRPAPERESFLDVLSFQSHQKNHPEKLTAQDSLCEIDNYIDYSQRQDRTPVYGSPSMRKSYKEQSSSPSRSTISEKGTGSPSPPRRIHIVENVRISSGEGSGSSLSPYLRSNLDSTPPDMSYNPVYKPSPREHLVIRVNEKSTRSPYSPVSRKHSLHPLQKSTPPLGRAHHGRGSLIIYEPEASPAKKVKYSPPPPYIPTAIRRPAAVPNQEELPEQEHPCGSDSEEEDPISLRMKLLRDLIEKRKTVREAPSNGTTPSVMSPRQDSTHSESSEANAVKDDRRNSFQDLISTKEVCEINDEEEEEDIKPPPVINRCLRTTSGPQPPTLSELSRSKLSQSDHQDNDGCVEKQDKVQDMGPTLAAEAEHCQIDSIFEENREVLSDTDLESLRAYIMKVQQHAHERASYSRVVDNTAASDDVSEALEQRDNSHIKSANSGDDFSQSLSTTDACSVLPSSDNPIIDSSFKSCTGSENSLSTETTKHSDSLHHVPVAISSLPSSLSLEPTISSSDSEKMGKSINTLHETVNDSELFSENGLQASSVLCENLDKTSEQGGIHENFSTMLVESSTDFNLVNGLPTAANGSQKFQDKFHHQYSRNGGPVSVKLDQLRTVSTTVTNTFVNAHSAANHTAISQSSTVKTSDLVYPVVVRDQPKALPSSSLSSSSEHSSLSLHSSQHYHTAGTRKYSNILTLPVHPQVVVPVNSSSDSDDDSDDETSPSATSSLVRHGDKEHTSTDFVHTAQGVLAEVAGSEMASSQYLKKQEDQLGLYQQSIQKDQRTVKLLVKRAVKFLEAQQEEQQKLAVIRDQLMALSRKMQTSDKLVMLFKIEKEKTEKQVQLMTERLLKKKRQYNKKMKSVVSLGTRLVGSSYMPRVAKPLTVSTSRERQNSNRAQHIAQEKQKLVEKEKQIAEKLRMLKESMAERESGKRHVTESVPDRPKNFGPRWKSQDVIRIDQDANPEVSAKQRRKSLLEMNPCTTPNIPLTPRRRSTASNAEKENVSTETVLNVKSTDKDVDTDLSSSFKMPTGMQLLNFCKLQREKTQKYLRGTSQFSVAGACAYPGLTGSQTAPASLIGLRSNEKNLRNQQDDLKFTQTSLAYSSHLLMFRSYRFNSYFRTKENLCLQSSSYSHKINPNSVLCPYDLQGTCNDDSCQQLHPKDYKFNNHELLEDIVSYCPKLAGVPEGASPEEVKKCIVAYVDSILSKHKGKMTIDDLCLWLSSKVNEACGKRHPHTINQEPRIWRPRPKEELGLSLDLDRKTTHHGIETINVDKKVVDKDAVVSEEDVRYFAADVTEMLTLEASTMEDQTNVQLWLKLASKKLCDSNRPPKECLDQALTVLARGLEANKNSPELWFRYLSLYQRHPEVRDFQEFCQTALEYAPSYDLWFLYLNSLNSYSEKEEASSQVLEFLYSLSRARVMPSFDVPKTVKTADKEPVHSEPSSEIIPERKTVTEFVEDVKDFDEKKMNVEDVAVDDIQNHADSVDVKEFAMKKTDVISNELAISKADAIQNELALDKVEDRVDRKPGSVVDQKGSSAESDERKPLYRSGDLYFKKLSHQVLEMVLYKICLNLLTGRTKTALHFLQVVLRLKKSTSFAHNLTDLLSSSDLLVLWLTYIHVLEWNQLPPHLYSVANQNPGRLLTKDHITLSWSSKVAPHSGVDLLLKLHERAASVWARSNKDEETTCMYMKLIQSHMTLLTSQDRFEEAIMKCRSVLSGCTHVDIWLTLADLYASCQDSEKVKQVFLEALAVNKYSSKLVFYQSLFLIQKGELEVAVWNLEQFAASHFEDCSLVHQCSSSLLYSQLLRQEESFSLHAAQLKRDVPDNLHKDIFLRLCFSLLLEVKGETSDAVEIFEKSLTHAQTVDDLVLVWQSYIQHIQRCRTSAKDVRETIVRSIISVPNKFPVPFTPHPPVMWVDYYHSNRVVEAWLAVLQPEDRLDVMEMCLGVMPNNVQLLLRAIDLCLELKESRRCYSWCRFVLAQADKPANLAFWKVATALAQMEGTPKEVEQMLIGCVETMPLAVSGWKDFLLYEVSRDNLVAVQKLLSCCQQLGLNIQGFVATLSAT